MSFNDAKYGRVAMIDFGQPGEQGTRIDGLRIAGHVHRKLGGSADNADVTVYGVTRTTESELARSGCRVSLYAGHGQSVPLLIQGNVVKDSVVPQDGKGRVLKFQIHDGGIEMTRRAIRRSWNDAITASDAARAIIKDSGLTIGLIMIGGGDITYPRGLTAYGSLRDIMDQLASDTGSRWRCQNGVVTMITRNVDDNTTQGLSISASEGMIGRPIRKDARHVEVKVILSGSLLPGARYQLKSEEFDGVHRAEDVVHDFDSQDPANEYATTILGRVA